MVLCGNKQLYWHLTSWCFRPMRKILVKLESFPTTKASKSPKYVELEWIWKGPTWAKNDRRNNQCLLILLLRRLVSQPESSPANGKPRSVRSLEIVLRFDTGTFVLGWNWGGFSDRYGWERLSMDSQCLGDMYDKSQVLHKLAERVAPISQQHIKQKVRENLFGGGWGPWRYSTWINNTFILHDIACTTMTSDTSSPCQRFRCSLVFEGQRFTSSQHKLDGANMLVV